MDAAGFATAHVAGNSLGGHVALQLATRGRARSVVAFAPAGCWAPGDPAVAETLRRQGELLRAARAAAPHAHAIAATREGRRRATELLVEDSEELPSALVEHLVMGVAAAPAAEGMLAGAVDADWSLDLGRIACPVRVVWGTRDRLLPWPSAAALLVEDRLPGLDRVELDGAGHCPQLELPLVAAELVLGHTGG
jgi:pimeloyl-ACP methyl ester carboxylesterase